MKLLGETIDDDRPVLQAARKDLLEKTDRIRLGVAFYVYLAISSVFIIVAGILGKLIWSDTSSLVNNVLACLLGVGTMGLCVLVFLREYKFIFEDWILNDAFVLIRAFYLRDRRSRRSPGSMLRKCLELVGNLEEIIGNQSDELLLALLASGKMSSYDDLIMKCMNVTTELLAKHPSCTILTRIDFANYDDSSVRRTAARLLPKSLWSQAVKTLLQSEYAEARIAAIQCATIPRNVLIKVCKKDEDQTVREAALGQIKEGLTNVEAVELSRSEYDDIRFGAVQSGLLPRKLLIRLCGWDNEKSIREVAWKRLH